MGFETNCRYQPNLFEKQLGVLRNCEKGLKWYKYPVGAGETRTVLLCSSFDRIFNRLNPDIFLVLFPKIPDLKNQTLEIRIVMNTLITEAEDITKHWKGAGG